MKQDRLVPRASCLVPKEKPKYQVGDRVYHAYLKCDRVSLISGGNYLVEKTPVYLDESKLYKAHIEITRFQSDRIEQVLTTSPDENAKQAIYDLVEVIRKYSRHCEDQTEYAESLVERVERTWKKRYGNLNQLLDNVIWGSVAIVLFLVIGVIALASQL